MKSKAVGLSFILIAFVLGLSGCAPTDKAEAIRTWKAEGKTEKIIALLADPIQATRLDAIEALEEMKATEAIEPLGALFTDADNVIVLESVEAIAAIGGPDAEAYLLQAITLDIASMRAAAATALGEYPSPEAVDALIIALDDYQYKENVMAAIESLGQLGGPKAVEALGAKLGDREADVRLACVGALRKIGGDAAMKGIATRLGDVNEGVRTAALDALKEHGAASAPIALELLRDENRLARVGALAVLDTVGAVPESGSDLVWYRLAQLTAEKKTEVDPAKAEVFVSIEERVPALLEGVAHASAPVREYAFIALEEVGEPAVEATVALAEEKATEKGLAWFNGRSEWSGVPSWRIDLWAAATALNPDFTINPVYVGMLAESAIKAEKVMGSEHFVPRREYLPFLIPQLDEKVPEDEKKAKKVEKRLTLAVKQINAAGHQAITPLVVALDSDNLEIAMRTAGILKAKADARIDQMVVDDCAARLAPVEEPEAEESEETDEVAEGDEPAEVDEMAEADGESPELDEDGQPVEVEEEVVEVPNPAEVLSGTPYHTALLEFDIPALKPLLAKIRPTGAVAAHAFNAKHPKVGASDVPLEKVEDPSGTAISFLLSYYHAGEMKESRVVYRLNNENTWIVHPAIPDRL